MIDIKLGKSGPLIKQSTLYFCKIRFRKNKEERILLFPKSTTSTFAYSSFLSTPLSFAMTTTSYCKLFNWFASAIITFSTPPTSKLGKNKAIVFID